VVQCILAGMSTRRIADQIGHQTTAMIDKIYGATTRENLANLGKIANEAVRSRLRERPKPLVDPGEDDGLPTSTGPERLKAVFFGDKLRALRLNAGMSQPQLAERVGLVTQKIKDLERGVLRPTVEMVVKFAEVFGTDKKYFEDAAA
jgi:DNA-binding XRE family transcriptional regulator